MNFILFRNESERNNDHPVYKAFMENSISNFSKDEVRNTVLADIWVYLKQIDDNLGRLLNI